MRRELVADLMTREVAVINRESDVHELERLLLEKQVHGLPVVDNEGRLVGVVSQTDLLNWHFNTGVDGASFYETADGRPSERDSGGLRVVDIQTARIEEVMSPVVHCIGPKRSLAVAACTMIRQRIHRLIVVDEKMHVNGIISALDLLRGVPGVDRLVGEHPIGAASTRPKPRADA